MDSGIYQAPIRGFMDDLTVTTTTSPRTRDTHTHYRAFSSGAVTTCVYDLGMLRLRFEHPTFRMRGQPTAPPPRSI